MIRMTFAGAIFVCAIVAFGGCKSRPSADETSLAAAQASVRDKMKDPDSAKFKNLRFNRIHRDVCGEVNGKNAFGGYTGYSVFSYDIQTRAVQMVPDSLEGENRDIATKLIEQVICS